jgi:hypothetical protein
MKKEIADKWVADLRTNPPQCKKVLYNGKGHCCLGRLYLVLGARFEEDASLKVYYPVFNEKLQSCTRAYAFCLSDDLIKAAGMQSRTGKYDSESAGLTVMNDNGNTFFQIADVIEKNWEKL